MKQIQGFKKWYKGIAKKQERKNCDDKNLPRDQRDDFRNRFYPNLDRWDVQGSKERRERKEKVKKGEHPRIKWTPKLPAFMR